MITVKKKLLLNLGNFSNLSIEAEISEEKGNWEDLWQQVNAQIHEQETLEKALRLNQPVKEEVKGNLPF